MPTEQDWRPYAAGFTSGILNVLVGHPLDTLKVRVQTGQPLRGASPASRFRVLIAGIHGPLLTVPIIGSLNFGLYDNLRDRLNDLCPVLFLSGHAADGSKPSPTLLNSFVSGTLGGYAVSHITCPMNNVKVQQQTVPVGGQPLGLWAAASRAGGRGLYKAYVPHAILEGFGRGVYMAGYELGKRCLGVGAQGGDGSDLLKRIACGSFGGALAWLTVYPIDTVRNRLMRDWQRSTYVGTADCLRQALRDEGVQGLYRGLSYSLVRAIPVAGVTLATYDMTLAALRS